MRILFVNPSLRLNHNYKILPVGLGMVMTYVSNNGYEFDLLDIDIDNLDDTYVENYISKNKYDIILFGTIVTHYKWVKWFCKMIKSYNENIIVGDTLDSAADFLSRMGPMSVPFENANEQTKEKVVSALKECYSKYFTPKGVEFHFSSWIVSALNP